MARSNRFQFIRTTRTNLATQIAGNGLFVGEPYIITDENVLAIGTSTNTVAEFAPRRPQIQTPLTGAGSITPTFNDDQVNLTGHTVPIVFNNPTGTVADGWGIVLRFKDSGTARAVTWGTQYRAATGLTLPSTTVVGKTHYVGMVYNAADTKWDVLSITSV